MRTYQNEEKRQAAAGNVQTNESSSSQGQSFMPPESWNGIKMPSLGGSAMPPTQMKKSPEEEMMQQKRGSVRQLRREKTYTHDPEAETALQQIAPQQMLYELAAHDVAYGKTREGVDPKVLETFASNGYMVNERGGIKFFKGTLGFRAVLIYPEADGKNPILAIRGTNPGKTREDFETIFTDLDQSAVGAQQFQQNKALIESIIEEAGGKVDVTGHSLGGAMAQHTAVNSSGSVSNVATFQSPGIDQASVDKFNSIPEEERPNATHHIVTGDLVDKAGDANIAGDVYEHDFGKFLNVFQLLEDVDSHLNLIKSAAGDLADIDFRHPSQNKTDYNALKNRIANMKAFLGQLGADVGDAHGTRVFSAQNYEGARAANDVSSDSFARGDTASGNKSNMTANLGKFDTHPHQDERKKAESIRSTLGPKIQRVFKAVWAALDAYNKVKDTVSSGVQKTKDAASYLYNKLKFW